MTKIYEDYADEPEDVFLPLPEKLACEFYDLEMDTYRDDCDHYNAVLPEKGMVLELGCGSGRVSRALCTPERAVIGLEISSQMLARTRSAPMQNCSYICADMTSLPFRSNLFDALVIPYNTLNLITEKEQIDNCLSGCKRVLKKGRSAYLQLFTPSGEFCNLGKKTFQFKMYDRPGGGRIIKEILKKYNPTSQTVEIEERYRVRPMTATIPNKDFNTLYTITGFPTATWIELFHQAGFTVVEMYADTEKTLYTPGLSTTLFAHLL
jgi:ubiquinone/menaquinone biosynthesis C-methylase UbiE